ncbi:hypothetical protein A45J_2531 [hot springs metagenome]|uniref:Uncharacterized protein n=1 Tax=hot springs metagenome TaxID=433727 RepID=A0A5J4L7P8_9ZZZZ
MLRETGKLLYRNSKTAVEIRKWFNLLLVYCQKKFLFWQPVGKDIQKQVKKLYSIYKKAALGDYCTYPMLPNI